MTDSTEVATTEPGGALEVTPERAAELAAAATSGIDRKDLVLPAVNLTQQLSRAVVDGDAPAGNFVNTLTGENYGDDVEFVVVKFFYGRFYSDKETNQAYAATGDIAPASWPEQYRGQAFVDLADAEERYKEWANEEGNEWGKGPKISTTYNFVGFLVPLPDAGNAIPVRFSLMRSNAKAAHKIITLIEFASAAWDQTISLEAEARESNNRPYFVATAKQGRQSTAEERRAALVLADVISRSQAALVGDEDSSAKAQERKRAAASSEGALAV